jgi:hypothetical protein
MLAVRQLKAPRSLLSADFAFGGDGSASIEHASRGKANADQREVGFRRSRGPNGGAEQASADTAKPARDTSDDLMSACSR